MLASSRNRLSPLGVRQTGKVIVSRHAVARYRQRVAPTLSRREALNELRELLAHAERRSNPPLWAATWRAQHARVGQEVTPAAKAPWEKHLVAVNWADSYLVVDDELCLPVNEGRVMTVIAKTVRVSPPAKPSGRSRAELEAGSRTAQQQQQHSKAQRQLAKSLARFRQRQVNTAGMRSLGRQDLPSHHVDDRSPRDS